MSDFDLLIPRLTKMGKYAESGECTNCQLPDCIQRMNKIDMFKINGDDFVRFTLWRKEIKGKIQTALRQSRMKPKRNILLYDNRARIICDITEDKQKATFSRIFETFSLPSLQIGQDKWEWATIRSRARSLAWPLGTWVLATRIEIFDVAMNGLVLFIYWLHLHCRICWCQMEKNLKEELRKT